MLLAITMGVGYFIGRHWGETQGEPNGMWYGLIGGFVLWALVLRPRSRRRRRRGGPSSHHSDYGDNDDSRFDSDGGDNGGGDD